MRRLGSIFVCGARVAAVMGAVLMVSSQAWAELTQVEIGGELRIRGRYYLNTFAPRGERIPASALGWRPIGPRLATSIFKWDSDGPDWTRYEHCLLLNVKADFSDSVTAFVEFYDFSIWGEDTRSDYLTGADSRGDSADDVMLNQGYVEIRDLFGAPLKLRVGRQALKFGKGFLVSDMLTPSQYSTHDAVRLTWTPADNTSIDFFASKLADRYETEQDGDTDFYGVYGTYTGWEPLTMSAYWFFLRDASHVENTALSPIGEWFEGLRDLDDYGATRLHTFGTNLFGKSGGFDYSLELAYQFGDAEHLGATFIPVTGLYGDQDAEYGNWGAEAIIGYTFTEAKWQPRPYVLGLYFQGHDERDISFGEWLNPFYKPDASTSFNRLFSDLNYMPVINDNGWLSNVAQVQLGLELQATEKVRLHAHVAKDWAVAAFDPPVSVKVGDRYVPIAPTLSFWTEEGSNDLGWEVATSLRYQYSADLWFLFYGSYLWAGEGLTRGAFSQFNGTEITAGTDDADALYFFWMAVLKF